MKCSIAGCPGEYEQRLVVYTAERGASSLLIEDVPAEVCSVCGDTLLTADTTRRIEQLLAFPPQPARTAPVFTFPLPGAANQPTVA